MSDLFARPHCCHRGAAVAPTDSLLRLIENLDFECVRWGSSDLQPQAGIGVDERGPDGLLAAARVYDDVEAPVDLERAALVGRETLRAADDRREIPTE